MNRLWMTRIDGYGDAVVVVVCERDWVDSESVLRGVVWEWRLRTMCVMMVVLMPASLMLVSQEANES